MKYVWSQADLKGQKEQWLLEGTNSFSMGEVKLYSGGGMNKCLS